MSTEKLQIHISQNSLVQMFKTRGQTNSDNNQVSMYKSIRYTMLKIGKQVTILLKVDKVSK